MGIRKRINYIGLFVFGCAIGLTGTNLYQSGAITLASDFLRDEASKTLSNGAEAYACTTKEEAESVFFVSCGGIY